MAGTELVFFSRASILAMIFVTSSLIDCNSVLKSPFAEPEFDCLGVDLLEVQLDDGLDVGFVVALLLDHRDEVLLLGDRSGALVVRGINLQL